MLNPVRTSRFKKEYKKSGRHDIETLNKIMKQLINQEALDPANKDHQLRGSYSDFRECHLAFDWLLIYKIDGQDIIFTRTGTHSELFE